MESVTTQTQPQTKQLTHTIEYLSISETPPMPRRRGRRRKRETEQTTNTPSRTPPTRGRPASNTTSDGRRTRSQVAQEWTTEEALILVKEITFVESDCLKALSWYQKWRIVVDNCTDLELNRTLNQCRRKWDSLLSEYNLIKQWESKFGSTNSFWLLESDERKENDLPEEIDYELFKAVDDYVRTYLLDSASDLDDDPEHDADLMEVIAKLDTRRQRRQSSSSKIPGETGEMETQTFNAEKNTRGLLVVEEPQKSCKEEEPLANEVKESHVTVLSKEGIQEEPRAFEVKESHDKFCSEEGIQETLPLSGSESQQQLSLPMEIAGEEAPRILYVQDISQQIIAPMEIAGEEVPRILYMEENSRQIIAENEHQKSCTGEEVPHILHTKEHSQQIIAENEHKKICTGEEVPHILYSKEQSQQIIGENHQKVFTKGDLETFNFKENVLVTVGVEPAAGHEEEKNEDYYGNEKQKLEVIPVCAKDEPEKVSTEKKRKRKYTRTKHANKEDTEKTMVQKLCNDVEMVHAIVEGSMPELVEFKSSLYSRNFGDIQCEFAKKQGDMLIGCLTDIVNIVKKFPHLFQADN